MPSPKAFTLKSTIGLLNALVTKVDVAIAFDPLTTNPHPQTIEYKGLWDTGATGTVVTKKVVDDLGLKQVGIVKVFHADGECLQPVYLVNVMLPHKVGFQYIRVTEGKLNGFDVLIGMDIISQGDFVITNSNKNTTFSFRTPSCECIDFVEETNKASVPTQNSFCPCGSGKKYKRCCGKK